MSKSQEVSQLAFAFSVLGRQSPGFFLALEGNLDRFVAGANAHNLANTCYAMAALDCVDENHKVMLDKLWSRLVIMKMADFQEEICGRFSICRSCGKSWWHGPGRSAAGVANETRRTQI